MYRLLEETADDLVAIRFSGKLMREDYEGLYSLLAQKSKEHEAIRIYEELRNFGFFGFLSTWNGIVPDFKFGSDIGLDKVAIVGGDRWAWLNVMLWKAINPVWPLRVRSLRYFDADDKEAALVWLRGDEASTAHKKGEPA
jgi:hypothetical protein